MEAVLDIPIEVRRAREQTAHRARWHEKHAKLAIKQPREPEPKPETTFLIRCKRRVDVFLVLARHRGLLRHLSWLWWHDVIKTFHRWWYAALWVRGAYQYVRWRLSPFDDPAVILVKAGTCATCEYRIVVDDGPNAGEYCDACICPRVPRAALTWKNLRSYPHCPKGKHPGSRIDPYARMKPCVGCGGKRNGK